MNEALVKYGFGGIVVAGMAYFIMWLMKEHKKERDNMMDRIEKMNDTTNEVTRENTNILSGLKTLLENQRRNGR